VEDVVVVKLVWLVEDVVDVVLTVVVDEVVETCVKVVVVDTEDGWELVLHPTRRKTTNQTKMTGMIRFMRDLLKTLTLRLIITLAKTHYNGS